MPPITTIAECEQKDEGTFSFSWEIEFPNEINIENYVPSYFVAFENFAYTRQTLAYRMKSCKKGKWNNRDAT